MNIPSEVIKIVNSDDSMKVLATVDNKGEAHVVFKQSIQFDSENNLLYLEFLEGSKTNANMTYSLWFDKPISINIASKDGKSYIITAVPKKTLVAGSIFEKYYSLARSIHNSEDLAAIYYFEILMIKEKTFAVRQNEHSIQHPLYMHIDRLAKKG